jgi:hypothetical protein
MADVDGTTDAAFDIEEDGADALVADFIVSALDNVDGTQGYEEDGARLFQQQQHIAPLVIPYCFRLMAASSYSGCCAWISDAFLSSVSRE